ncbi:alkanal monooxygenase [Knoellia flava TL1]|uniref:Alkanal monooxygenase n=2 Tax=Knoellia flava TaxID=913969 RepID=A0A8H9KNY0_9MICO|nr:LLM class flavin-dependent oxidoreductase [Knoellia flava]KGN30477.1 alkanal monooxygenase [Knoellia flava TL1]GGB65190.1 alkanal monooxygenase [Knoellia flava]
MSPAGPRLSLLDLATVGRDQPIGEALEASTVLAQKADSLGGFERLWFAEHHNMPSIASAATAVLLAHVAARTERLRVGSGGVMLPNHSPLVIAEQFGTLAELHPGRIDLGLGRAPGTDQVTMRALRADPRASDRFPDDVLELQGYLSDESLVPTINAIPGRGTKVPLYILGSSLFGAQLAARLGLPYAFASHFAPDALVQAIEVYRREFRPSEQLAEPYAIAALNVVVADEQEHAEALAASVLRSRVRSLASRVPAYAGRLDDAAVDELMGSPVGMQARHMMTYSAVGDIDAVRDYLTRFAEHAQADELMVTNAAPGLDNRLRALELLASE